MLVGIFGAALITASQPQHALPNGRVAPVSPRFHGWGWSSRSAIDITLSSIAASAKLAVSIPFSRNPARLIIPGFGLVELDAGNLLFEVLQDLGGRLGPPVVVTFRNDVEDAAVVEFFFFPAGGCHEKLAAEFLNVGGAEEVGPEHVFKFGFFYGLKTRHSFRTFIYITTYFGLNFVHKESRPKRIDHGPKSAFITDAGLSHPPLWLTPTCRWP